MLTWRTINVSEYQTVHSILTGPGDEVDMLTDVVGVLSGRSRDEVDDMPITRFRKLYKRAQVLSVLPPVPSPRRSIKSPKRRFIPLFDLLDPRFRFGMYCDLQFLLKTEDGNLPINRLHEIAAAFYLPFDFFRVGKNIGTADAFRARANEIQGAPFLPVYQTVLILQQQLQLFHHRYRGLLGIDEDGEQGGELDVFQQQYGWQFAAQQIAEYERITVDEAYNLPLIQAFNDLAYLKAKAQHETNRHAEQKH